MTLTKNHSIFALLLGAALCCSSCKTTDKITYFQDADLLPDTLVSSLAQLHPAIEPGEELRIFVSAENMAAVAGFNKPAYSQQPLGSATLNTMLNFQTYRVDPEGDIDFPTLGTVHVAGLKTEELEQYLKQRISEYVNNPIVTVDPVTFPVLVLGEVNSPGVTYHDAKHCTLLEAIAKAHDLNIYGDRTNVLVMREEEGRMIKHRLDLTKSDVLTSPYYYVKQHDVIYVAPNHARKSSSHYDSMKQQNISVISTIVGAVSVLTSLAIAIWK